MIPLLSVIFAMASIQSGASLAKSLFTIITPQGLTMLRLMLAAVILLCIFKPWKTILTRSQIWAVGFYGVSLGGMNLLFYMSLQRIPLGVAVAFEFTGPLALAIISSRRIIDLVWVAFAIAGIVVLSPINQLESSVDPVGIAYAIAAGVCWALYIVFGQRAGTSIPGHVAAAWGMTAAAIIVIPIALLMGGAKGIDWNVVPMALVVAVLSSALPYSLEMVALKKLPTATFSILMSLEPVLAAMSGLVFINEQLSLAQWGAITCIVLASLGSTLTHKRNVRA